VTASFRELYASIVRWLFGLGWMPDHFGEWGLGAVSVSPTGDTLDRRKHAAGAATEQAGPLRHD